jgi:putative MATE family efflux protein
MATSKQKDLTRGPIVGLLLQLTWPMTFGMLGMVLFNLADSYFVGKIGVTELAAIGFTFPAVLIINSVILGMGIGTSSLVSRSINRTERFVVQRMASHAILLGLVTAVVLICVGQLTIDPVFRLLGASEEALVHIRGYMRVWYFGLLFVVIPMIGNNIIRATGDTFTPGLIMTTVALVNILLDPLLIFGWGFIPAFSVQGAAIATVSARGVSLLYTLYILIWRERLLTVHIGTIQEVWYTWKKIAYVAVPAMSTILITPLSTALVTRIVAVIGESAVAAFGVVSRLEMFSLIIVHALGTVMTIFSGQNWGKGVIGRVRRGFYAASSIAVVWGVFLFAVFSLYAEQVAGLFTSEPAVIDIIARYLVIVSFSYAFQGIMMVGMSMFNGINQPLPSACLSALRVFVIYVPFAWLAVSNQWLSGVFWSACAANIITGTATFMLLKRRLRVSVRVQYTG